jgi:hypothetical protein
MKFSLFRNGITNNVPSETIDLETVCKLVKSFKYERKIKRIRDEKDKKKQNELKSKLDYVTFSGVFDDTRIVQNLSVYSGFVQLDIDNIDVLGLDIDAVKFQLKHDPYIALMFLSPRGNGLKMVVKVDATAETHKSVYLDLSMYFKNTYNLDLDTSVSSVASACYLSYDSDPFYNALSEVYKHKGIVPKSVPLPHKKTIEKVMQSTDFEYIQKIVNRVNDATNWSELDYENWLLCGFALATLGENGRDLFNTLSKKSDKYDQKTTDDKFNDALKNSRFTSPAKFIDICKSAGIDVTRSEPKPAPKPTPVKVATKLNETTIVVDSVTMSKRQKNRRYDDYDESEYLVHYDETELQIKVKEGQSWNKVTEDFLLFIKYRCQNEKNELSYILEIKHWAKDGIDKAELEFIEISHDFFMSAEKLKSELMKKWFSLKIKPASMDNLRTFLTQQKRPTLAKKIIRFGYDDDSGAYVFANCAIKDDAIFYPDSFNMITVGQHVLAMPDVETNKVQPFTFVANDKLTFNDFYKELREAYTEKEVFLAVSFYLSSLFRDICVEQTGASPMLFFNGAAGTGKTTILRLLTTLFGFQQKELNLKSANSKAAISDEMSTLSNCFLLMDEYKPGQDYEPILQASYDNVSRKIKDMDNLKKSVQLPIKSSIALVSNYMPTEEWFLMRCMYVNIGRRERTAKREAAFKNIRTMAARGCSQITVDILKHRALIKEHFKSAYEHLQTSINDRMAHLNVADRIVNNMAQTLAIPYILHTNSTLFMVESEPIECFEDFLDWAVYYINIQVNIMSDKSLTADLFNIIQQMYEERQIWDGVHFYISTDAKRRYPNTVVFNFSTVYEKLKKLYPKYNGGAICPDKKMFVSDLCGFYGFKDESNLFGSGRFRSENSDENAKKTARNEFVMVLDYSMLQEKFNLDLSVLSGQKERSFM